MPLDGLPRSQVWRPGMRRRQLGRELGRLVGVGDAIRIDPANAQALAPGRRVKRGRAIAERDVDPPEDGAFPAIAPKERRGRDLRRGNLSFLRIIDRDGRWSLALAGFHAIRRVRR